jgi:AcrR family transcriptional regulator
LNQRADRGQATRRHIIEAATRLFAEAGYETVSIETILQACGISRGALYHHFAGKEAVFTAVLEAVEERIAARLVSAASGAADPVAALRAGCAAWLDLADEDPVVRRVVLTEAPGVIGWQAWRALDERYTLGLIRSALAAASAAGRMRAESVEVSAHVLLAALAEVALLIARSPGDATLMRNGREVVERFLDSLFAPPAPPRRDGR